MNFNEPRVQLSPFVPFRKTHEYFHTSCRNMADASISIYRSNPRVFYYALIKGIIMHFVMLGIFAVGVWLGFILRGMANPNIDMKELYLATDKTNTPIIVCTTAVGAMDVANATTGDTSNRVYKMSVGTRITSADCLMGFAEVEQPKKRPKR